MKTKKSIPQVVWGFVKGNPIVVMMAIVSIIVGFTIDRFFSFENMNVLLGNTTIRFLIALGVSGCLITKGTDLSAAMHLYFTFATTKGNSIKYFD